MSNTAKTHVFGLALAIIAVVLIALVATQVPALSYGKAADGAEASGSAQVAGEHSLAAIHASLGAAFDTEMEVVKENCVACHADYVEATADYNQMYNPHADREGMHFPNVKCYRCHSMNQDPVNWCTTCHNGLVLGDGWQALPLM